MQEAIDKLKKYMNSEMGLALDAWARSNRIDCVKVFTFGNSIQFDTDEVCIEFKFEEADEKIGSLNNECISLRQLGLAGMFAE